MILTEWGIPELTEEMGLLLEAIQPNDAILMWPVTVLGQKEADGYDLHITLIWGKWDQSKEELKEAVSKVLSKKDLKLPSFSSWAPDIFKGQEKSFHVLKIQELKADVDALRKELAPIFNAPLRADYIPHVSVSKSLHDEIVSKKLTPKEAGLKIGDLELRLGQEIIELNSLTEARYPLPAAQKMVLIDMVKNDRRWREWPGGFFVPEDETRARGQERLFTTYVLWHVIRSLLSKGLVFLKRENNIRFFEITEKGVQEISTFTK
jgi:hypothetical protein